MPEINLAYIDSNPALMAGGVLPKPEVPGKDANLLESKAFDREQWLRDQAALTAQMSSMYYE